MNSIITVTTPVDNGVDGLFSLSYYSSPEELYLNTIEGLKKISSKSEIATIDANISIIKQQLATMIGTTKTYTKNLFNPNAITLGAFIDPNGAISAYALTDYSDYIPVKANTAYTISSQCRKVCVYDVNKTVIAAQGKNPTGYMNITVTPLQDGFIRVTVLHTSLATTQVEIGTVATAYVAYGEVESYCLALPSKSILKSNLEQSVQDTLNNIGGTPVSSTTKILTVKNADKIGCLGDSYLESAFALKGKAYINNLSLFSDYNFENFGKSGDTYRGNLDRIRRNTPTFHSTLAWKDFKPKYALLIAYANDLKYMNNAQYGNDLRALVETVKTLGAIPLISTAYHTNFGAGIQILLKQIAREYDGEFIDIVSKVAQLRGTDKVDFWGGSHPGTRTNALETDNYEKYLSQLPRPTQSLKIFRPRTSTVISSLDDLIFYTNNERAKKFKEIAVGHTGLTDPKYVDKCTIAAQSKVNSEYLVLQNGENVSFTNYALVSAVLPCVGINLSSLKLILSDVTANVYIKNILATPYPSLTYYQRFDFTGSPMINIGNTYTSSDPSLPVTFTVGYISGNSVYMTPNRGATSATVGTMTLVTGTGDATFTYYYTSIGFDSTYPVGKQNIGHWQQLSLTDGKFDATSYLNQCVDYDKVHFLIQKTGTFNLNNISVEWSGTEGKSYKTKDLKLEEPAGAEMLIQPYIGNATQLSAWGVIGAITVYTPIDNNLPSSCLGCVDVSSLNKVFQSMTYTSLTEDTEIEIKVWARYFPNVYDPTTDYALCSITEDTYDYADISLDVTIGSQVFTMSDKVGLHWKEIVFRSIIPCNNTTQNIKVYSQDKTIQLAKVSVKKVIYKM